MARSRFWSHSWASETRIFEDILLYDRSCLGVFVSFTRVWFDEERKGLIKFIIKKKEENV